MTLHAALLDAREELLANELPSLADAVSQAIGLLPEACIDREVDSRLPEERCPLYPTERT